MSSATEAQDMATVGAPGFLRPFTRVVPPTAPNVTSHLPRRPVADAAPDRDPAPQRDAVADPGDVGGTLDIAISAAPASPGQKLLTGVTMTGQEESNWCWAAVTQAVRAWAGSTATQTDVATSHIKSSGRTMACTAPNAAASSGQSCAAGGHCQGDCNDQHILSVVLTESGRLKARTQAAPSFSYLASLLDAGSPVPCRVQWTPSGGHFIMVVGWTVDAAGNQLVHVLDPATAPGGSAIGRKIWRYVDFISNYRTAGSTGTINYSYEVH